MALRSGLTASIEHEVGPADTAAALGSGTLGVLGTPRVLALLEAATVRAVDGELEAGGTTVGTRVELDHTAATPLGGRVRAEAELTEVDGRRLRFAVCLRDGAGEAARGVVERAVVHGDRFMAKASNRG